MDEEALAEDGATVIANGMMPPEAFYAAYEQASGRVINRRTLQYYSSPLLVSAAIHRQHSFPPNSTIGSHMYWS